MKTTTTKLLFNLYKNYEIFYVTENIGLFTEDELVAKGYQLTDTGWVKA